MNCEIPCYDTDYYIIGSLTITILILYATISSIC